MKREEKSIAKKRLTDMLSYVKHMCLKHIMLKCFLSQQKQPVKKPV